MSVFSITFIGFLAVLIALYFLLPKKCQWIVLLAASIVFYLSAGWKEFAYIVITIVSQYFLALALQRRNKVMGLVLQQKNLNDKQKKQIIKKCASSKKRYVLISALLNIGILCFVKYVDLTIGSINQHFGAKVPALNILMPLGLSYYTFKSVGYVIDVYRGRIRAQRNILKLALYISYFPALIQGPIDRYENLAGQLFKEHVFDYNRFTFGVQRMLWGYIKKLVIADRIAVIVNEVLGYYSEKGYVGFTVLFAIALYSFQIYADFSGGMDIVMGVSEIFGISLTENFRQPFFATNVAEYWRRWHISLVAWMRTYVFYPLSLSPAFKKLVKKCRNILGDRFGILIAPSIALFITFFLVGMWHGAGWNYVLFSISVALLVSARTLLENVYDTARSILGIKKAPKSFHIFQRLCTFCIMAIGWYITLAKDLQDIRNGLRAAFTHFNPWVFLDGSFYTLGLDRPNFLFMLFFITVLLVIDYLHEKGIRIRQSIGEQNIIFRWCIYYAAIIVLVIFGMYG